MTSIQLLEKQHRQVEKLFRRFETAGRGAKKTKERILHQLADAIALHSELEERVFYPESRTGKTEEMLREAVEEHLSVKRLIADLLETGNMDAQLGARVKVLKEQIEHHVEEEEGQLFPKVKKERSKAELADQGARMQELARSILARGAEPSRQVSAQTDAPAQI